MRADFHTYFVGCDEWGFSVWAHNTCYGDFLKALGKADTPELKAFYENAVKNPKPLAEFQKDLAKVAGNVEESAANNALRTTQGKSLLTAEQIQASELAKNIKGNEALLEEIRTMQAEAIAAEDYAFAERFGVQAEKAEAKIAADRAALKALGY